MVVFLILYLVSGLLVFGWVAARMPKWKEFRHEISTILIFVNTPFAAPGFIVFIAFWPFVLALDYAMYRLAKRAAVQPASALSRAHDREVPESETAVCVTDLRPSGKVRVAGKTYDATATNRFIEKGTSVRIIRKQGFTLIVEPMQPYSNSRASG